MQDRNKANNKKLLRGAAFYGLGTFGTKILAFLIVPLYTYYITASDMGIYDVLVSTVSLLTPLVTFQISEAAYRWMIRHKEHDIYIRTTYQVLLINCSLAAILIYLFALVHPFPYSNYFILMLLTARCLESLQKLLRGLLNQQLFAVSGIMYTFVFLMLNFIQIVFLNVGITSFFLSAIIANCVTIVMIFGSEKRLRVSPFKTIDQNIVKKMFIYSTPLVLNQLNWWVMNSSDRYIVLIFVGTVGNGILAIANKFPAVFQIVLALFTNSWQDMSIGNNEKDQDQYYSEIFEMFYKVALTSLFAAIPVTYLLVTFIMSVEYKIAATYVPFYFLGGVFNGFAAFYGVGYLRNKNTKGAFKTSVYGAIANFIVSISLVQFIGLQAAALSTFVGFYVMWFTRMLDNKKDDIRITVNYRKFNSLLLATIAVSIISIYGGVMMNVILMVVGGCLFIVINYQELLKLVQLIMVKVKKR